MGTATRARCVSIKDATGHHRQISERTLLAHARRVIVRRLTAGATLTSTRRAKQYARILLGGQEREVFYAIWLNSQNAVLRHGVLFQGTIDRSAVYTRELVKAALQCNAAKALLAHNHPSGDAEPSQADIEMTCQITLALRLVDVEVVDHIIVGRKVVSLAELGKL